MFECPLSVLNLYFYFFLLFLKTGNRSGDIKGGKGKNKQGYENFHQGHTLVPVFHQLPSGEGRPSVEMIFARAENTFV